MLLKIENYVFLIQLLIFCHVLPKQSAVWWFGGLSRFRPMGAWRHSHWHSQHGGTGLNSGTIEGLFWMEVTFFPVSMYVSSECFGLPHHYKLASEGSPQRAGLEKEILSATQRKTFVKPSEATSVEILDYTKTTWSDLIRLKFWEIKKQQLPTMPLSTKTLYSAVYITPVVVCLLVSKLKRPKYLNEAKLKQSWPDLFKNVNYYFQCCKKTNSAVTIILKYITQL